MAEKKTQQVGMLTVDDKGRERIQLGNLKNTDPKYNYTVQVRVLDAAGNVIVTKTNPSITLWDPKKGPAWLKKNLTVDLIDFVPTKQE